MQPFGLQDPTFSFCRGNFVDVSGKRLNIKVDVLRMCKLIQLNSKNTFEEKRRGSETTKPIKQSVNVFRAEIVN